MKNNAPIAPKEAFIEFLKEFVQESDRAAIVLGSAKIEELLGELITSRLVPPTKGKEDLVDQGKALAAFHVRLIAAKRLGLIDDEFSHNIDVFRRLRNQFVHTLGSSIEKEPHSDRVQQICQPYRDFRIYQDGIEAVQQQNLSLTKRGAALRVTLALMIVRLERACQDTDPLQPSITFSLTSEHWLAK